MPTNTLGGSARIYEFPQGGRAGIAARRDRPGSSLDLAALGAAEASCGSSWYHEAAVQEAGSKDKTPDGPRFNG